MPCCHQTDQTHPPTARPHSRAQTDQNRPNPFSEETTIGFYLPKATFATLKISDVSGKIIKLVEGNFEKGYQEIELSKFDLGTKGVLYYELRTPEYSGVRRMVLIE